MSDIDENLTSILSSLIDADGIVAAHSLELVDNNALDFQNLANCITGNDASLHQTSDENVSSLLETHLNVLTRSVTTSIVDTTADHLHDVGAFDLDKPIDSLLGSTPSEYMTHSECGDESLTIHHKSTVLSDVTNGLMPLHSDALNGLDHVQSVLDDCTHHTVEICTDYISHTHDLVQSTFSTQNYALNDHSIPISLDGIVINGELDECMDADITISTDYQCNQPFSLEITCGVLENGEKEAADLRIEEQADLEVVEEERIAEENGSETIVADQVINDALVTDANSTTESRRLLCDDGISDNSELTAEREKLPKSKPPTPTPREAQPIENRTESLNVEYPSSTTANDRAAEHINGTTETNGDNAELYATSVDDVGYVRDPNEKPGPKSKKQSTYLYNALKAKALLESAIVIPARKRKKRVIDSDGEFNESQPIDSVDDIGLISDDNRQMSLNVTIETEQKMLFVSEKRPFEVAARSKISRLKDGSGKDALTRSTTQAKMEKYHANNNRRSRKKKESKDYFDMPLNAPYVDTSSDEDYFVPHESNKKSHQHNSHHWHKNGNASSAHQRKKKGYIPDEIYFNSTVPLHVLYAYDDSSSDEERRERSRKSLFSSSTRTLNKMPPVHKIIPRLSHRKSSPMHKIIPKQFDRGIKIPKHVSKPTVFEQLDKLKRLLRASGIKVNINELLKGSKTFQERCERIRNTLHSEGIEGEPTMAKCKQLKKQLKLKEEIAGLDPSVIIESKDENDGGRSKRTTRTATRRNYVYDDQFDATKSSNQSSNTNGDGATITLLQEMREFMDSESEYDEVHEHSKNGNNNNNNQSSNDDVEFGNAMETVAITNGQIGISVSSPMQEYHNKLKPLTENLTQVITDKQSISTTNI